MQTTSAEYKLEIKKPSRSFECKITIGNNVYFNEDIVDIILETVQPNEGYSIGNTTSQSLELTLINKGDTIYSASQIKLEIGLRVGSIIEYILMGYYNIDEVEKTDYTTKITAFDNMIKFETPYFSSLGEIATLQQIVNELSTITGVQFTGSLPAYTVKKLEGFTCREVLGYVASLCGGNAHITRNGKFTIIVPKEVDYSITGDNYFDYKREEVKYKIGKISCKADDKEFTKGTLGTDSMELQLENPWVTEAILTDIYNKLNGFSYLGYTMKWQGDLALDPGDIISITDKKGVIRKVPILSQKFTYTGGLTAEIGAKGESKNKNSFNSSGSGANKVDRVVTELLLVKEALIDKANIQELEAVQIRTQTLEAKTVTIEKAIIDVAHISDLTAINAKIENLVAEDVKINKALIDKATIGDLNALNAKIVTMEVSVGKIGTLEANLATIQTLVNGNLTSDNIHSLVLTAEKVTVENGFIKNAMIDTVDVAKVNAGDISTNKFRIVSDSGNMLIADNTIQISDATRVRVQIGKDASNDYSMYVWDAAGKLMFDANGLKAEGIKSKIIRDDMISDTANINSSKLNISSIVTSINDGTTTINSSKVLLDGTAQTLNVAFNKLETTVSGIEIGGRNYIRPTKVLSYTPYATVIANNNNGWTVTKVDYPSYPKSVAIKQSGFEIPVGKTITFSGYATINNVPIPNDFFESGKLNTYFTKVPIIKVNNGHFEIVQLCDTNGYNWIIHCQLKVATGDVIEFSNLKFEVGNKATDWTPAPEDIDGAINSVKEITTSNTTALNIQQGLIDTLISNTTIIKDGVTTQLKDAYNATVLKVDSMQSTIGSHTSQINDVTGKVTGVETKVNDVKRDLDGIVSTVSGHTSQINGLTSTVSTQGSIISQLQNQIALKVESSQVTNIAQNVVDGVTLSARNIILTSKLDILDNTAYNTAIINLSKSIEPGKKYTMVIRGKITGTQKLGLWQNGGANLIGYTPLTTTTSTVVYQFTSNSTVNSSWTNKLSFYNYPSTGASTNPASIEWVTLYEGLVKPPLDWAPAPEDTDSAIDGVYDNISKVESEITQKYEAAIKIAEGNITNSISETYTTKNEFGEFVSGEFSNIKQDVNSVRTEIGSVETRVEEVNGELVNYQTLVATYMQFTEIGLEIGKTNSKFRALLDNEKLAFTQDNKIVSYISNNKMYITDTEILGRLTVGKAPLGFWDWSQRSNGNFGLQWRAQ